MDLTVICRVTPWKYQRMYTYSSTKRSFYKMENILGNKNNLNKLRNSEIFPCLLSYHSEIKLKMNNNQSSSKDKGIWRSNNSLLNDEWNKEKNQKRNFNILKLNEIEKQHNKGLGTQQRQVFKKNYSFQCLHQKNQKDLWQLSAAQVQVLPIRPESLPLHGCISTTQAQVTAVRRTRVPARPMAMLATRNLSPSTDSDSLLDQRSCWLPEVQTTKTRDQRGSRLRYETPFLKKTQK